MAARASVVIPAHNEEGVIGELLASVAPAAAAGELDVYVVCNGCSDETGAAAASYPGVQVVETPARSKIAALNLGDEHAGEVYPRLYLDADIRIGLSSLWQVVDRLEVGPELAAAPRLEVVTDGRPWLVRRYYQAFLRSGWVLDSMIGSGFYGLSRKGRERFGAFPDLINDDLFVRSLFSSEERVALEGAAFEIEAPRSTWALVKAKARVQAGTGEFLSYRAEAAEAGVAPAGAQASGGTPALWRRGLRFAKVHWVPPLEELARSRGERADLIAYHAVRAAAGGLAVGYRLSGAAIPWGQDRTTRARGAV